MPPCKGHKKSRRGCIQCKTRHVKCDEQRPACLRCVAAARQCSYTIYSQQSRSPDDDDKYWPTFNGHWQGQTPPNGGLQAQPSPSGTDQYSWAESLRLTATSCFHIELFHNFTQSTCMTVARTDAEVEVYRRTVLSRVFHVPYLLQATLALSALQLSLKPTSTINYKHAATVLQSQALASFDAAKVLDKVDKDNVLELVLFQHLTAVHVFCDTFTSSHADFGEFLEELVRCIQLLRGVNSVTNKWWDVLAQTELGEVMNNADAYQNSSHASGDECRPLLEMLETADLSSQSIEVCQASVKMLQSFIDAEHNLDERAMQSTNMLFAWLITATPEYTSLLLQRRPEALIILAYYTVPLHNRRRSWAIAQSGKNILQHITRYVGSSWESTLAWPHSVVFAEASEQISPP